MASVNKAPQTVAGFAEGARRAFTFLGALGFREDVAEYWPIGSFPRNPRAIAATPDTPLGAAHVGFASAGSGVAVDVYHDPRAEVSVSVRQVGSDWRFDLWHILLFVGAPEAAAADGVYASAETSAASVSSRLGELLDRYGGRWLRGEADAFEQLTEWVAIQSALYTETVIRDARPATETEPVGRAWQTRDFKQLVTLIDRLPRPLTRGEQRARDYAQRELRRV